MNIRLSIQLAALGLALAACHRDHAAAGAADAQATQASSRGGIRFVACQGHDAGDPCTIAWHEHELTGTCQPIESGLVCRPAPRPEAVAACQGHAAGAPCTIALPDHDVQGTCVIMPGAGLACRGSWRHGNNDGTPAAAEPQ